MPRFQAISRFRPSCRLTSRASCRHVDQGGQVDKPHAVRKGADQLAGNLDGESRLTASTRAGDRQQACSRRRCMTRSISPARATNVEVGIGRF